MFVAPLGLIKAEKKLIILKEACILIRSSYMKGLHRLAVFAGLFIMAVTVLAGCGIISRNRGVTLVVGSKDFTENKIVAELYSLALEDAGYTVKRAYDIPSTYIHNEMVYDNIDIYPEYTGTGLVVVLGEEPISDPDEVFDRVSRDYEKNFNIIWLDRTGVNDGEGLVIRKDVAERLHIATISELNEKSADVRFATTEEFAKRTDGMSGLVGVYGEFDFKSETKYSNEQRYDAVLQGEADVTEAYTTDGKLADGELIVLEDDKHFWPPYELAPLVRGSVLRENEDIRQVLKRVSNALDNDTMIGLNYRADMEGEDPLAVAKDFYKKRGW